VSRRERIRVLVIDDSAFSRRTITRMLESSPLVEVAGVARDGEEALMKTFELKPDLITLDLEMPRMDGFTYLRLVMAKRPTPILVISGRSGDQDVFKALDLGAVDFIAKPAPRPTPELESIQQELIRKVHAIRQLRIDKVRDRIAAPPSLVTEKKTREGAARVVVIGASTGGPAALMQVLGSFVEAPPIAFLVAQHMPAGFTMGFAERLDRLTCLRAHEAEDGDEPEEGLVLLAPGGQHLCLESRSGRPVARLVPGEPADKYVPSVDRLFSSAAKCYASQMLAVVLTGMGDDGRKGVRAVSASGGRVIAESEDSAVIFGMPLQAIRTGVVDAVLPLGEIGPAIQGGIPRPGARTKAAGEPQ
jgi:two-component system chemotaxis response regulator CheB